jgi:hypothetical protein
VGVVRTQYRLVIYYLLRLKPTRLHDAVAILWLGIRLTFGHRWIQTTDINLKWLGRPDGNGGKCLPGAMECFVLC